MVDYPPPAELSAARMFWFVVVVSTGTQLFWIGFGSFFDLILGMFK